MKEHVCREKACVFGNVYLFSMSLFQFLRLSPQNYWQHFLTLYILIYHPFLWFHLHTTSLCCHLFTVFVLFCFFVVVFCLFCVCVCVCFIVFCCCKLDLVMYIYCWRNCSIDVKQQSINQSIKIYSTLLVRISRRPTYSKKRKVRDCIFIDIADRQSCIKSHSLTEVR